MTLPAPGIHVFERESGFLDAAILLWTRSFEEGLRRKGRFCAALSGGKTPIPFYRKLARQNRADSWRRTHLFLADERFGPPGHPDSNGRMIEETLVRPAGIGPGNAHPVPLDKENAEQSAEAYEESLRGFFRLNREEFPGFDFILLGIGGDGHTASLFPGTPAPEETERAVAAVNLGAARGDRVTLTLPVLNRGAAVVFLVQGEEKAEIVRRVAAEKDPSLPAARVRPPSGGLYFLLDRAAALRIPFHLQQRGVP